MRTSLTKPYDGSSVGRDERQLLLDPDHHLHCATQLWSELIWLGIITVYSLSLAQQQIITTVFPFFTISMAWHFLFLVLCLCLCFQVTHVFWKWFCLGLISSSFTAFSRTPFLLLSLSSIFQSQGLKAKPGMIISCGCYSQRTDAHTFSRVWRRGRGKYAKEKKENRERAVSF